MYTANAWEVRSTVYMHEYLNASPSDEAGVYTIARTCVVWIMLVCEVSFRVPYLIIVIVHEAEAST